MKKVALILTLLLLTACVSLITPKVQSDVSKLKAGQYSLDKSHASLLFTLGYRPT